MNLKQELKNAIVKPELVSAHNMFVGNILKSDEKHFWLKIDDDVENTQNNIVKIPYTQDNKGIYCDTKVSPEEPQRVLFTQPDGNINNIEIIKKMSTITNTADAQADTITAPNPNIVIQESGRPY